MAGQPTPLMLKANGINLFINYKIPQTNFGKIALGQNVLLKFPAYPFQEYGHVSGQIDFVSNIPTDSGYIARVILPNALTTSYKKQIQFREGLLAEGDIITKEVNLLQRLLNMFVGELKR